MVAELLVLTAILGGPLPLECETVDGVTVCGQGDVRSSGPYVPYDCADDWSCDGGPTSLFTGWNDGCVNAYGNYQNCN